MSVTEHATGSQTAVIGTEHTLTANPETTAGVFQLFVDANAMVAGDILELRFKEKARSGDTQRQVWLATFQGPLSSVLIASPSLALKIGWDVSLKQTAGTGRAYPWSIRKAE